MTLPAGTKLGPYEIVSPLGAGGMGEVYRARDGKLDREVAIKVLPDVMARDPERVARFQREAKLLAALNHPNIAAIYGFEQADDKRFLVLELVEGDTLAERLRESRLPVDEALAVAKQIAEALDAAHDRGVIHRDLKPANIKIDPDGRVKVLDFGLAKALTTEPAGSAAADSPTITVDRTQAGVLLGTAGYMSPEQARGRPVDKRTDIFSFGCVLFECLTGSSLFVGETVTDSLGAVLHEEPDWTRLPPHTPPSVQLLLRRCLAKDRKQRLRDIGDARLELEDTLAGQISTSGPSPEHEPRATRRQRLLRAVAWSLAPVVVLTAVAARWLESPSAPAPPLRLVRLAIALPKGALSTAPVISPDGAKIVFEAGTRLWIQRLDRLGAAAVPVQGSEGGRRPFSSPDSESLAFGAPGELLRVDLADGNPVAITDNDKALGASGGGWLRDDIIYYNAGRHNDPTYRISAGGGHLQRIHAPNRFDNTRILHVGVIGEHSKSQKRIRSIYLCAEP